MYLCSMLSFLHGSQWNSDVRMVMNVSKFAQQCSAILQLITIITMVVYQTLETLNDGINSGMTGIYTGWQLGSICTQQGWHGLHKGEEAGKGFSLHSNVCTEKNCGGTI
ncbi:hypothetical protein GmHk_10G028100 [Glycine max]|nr:hypothetical protein GmHk_10G028100 [Glycine max]